MSFRELQQRLIAVLKALVQNGGLSERRLARLTGISQPHIHNVLKGARILSPEIADRIMSRLRVSALDLIGKEELRDYWCSQCAKRNAYAEVPILDGWLGPGLPLSMAVNSMERYPLPRSYLEALEKPAIARLACDLRMARLLSENDLVLLDQSAQSRSQVEEDGLYVVSRNGEGVIRRLRLERRQLCLIAEDYPDLPECWERISLARKHLPDIVKARVVWIGRHLKRSN